MIRKFKTLGLALAAVLAMSAVVASAAQAQFTANSYPTTVTALNPFGDDVFTVDGSSAECVSHFEGTATEASSTITIVPIYTVCQGVFGFAEGTFTENGCDYVFHSNGEVDIACPAGASMVIAAGNCEVKIGAQSGLKAVALSNSGGHINMQANISGITANATKDGFLCPLNGTGHKTATYVQGSAVTAKPVSGGSSISVD
jgi:hypothetical protein